MGPSFGRSLRPHYPAVPRRKKGGRLGTIRVTAPVRLAADNTATIRSVAERLGVTADLSWCEAGDLALGTWEARLVELVAAFAAVANGGPQVRYRCT